MNYINRNEKIYGVKIFITNFKFLMSQQRSKGNTKRKFKHSYKELIMIEIFGMLFLFPWQYNNISMEYIQSIIVQNESSKPIS